MRVTIQDQVYETENMSQPAQDLVARIVFVNNQVEALNIAKAVYEDNLVKLLNENRPVVALPAPEPVAEDDSGMAYDD